MAITQFRIINTEKGILNITADNLHEVKTPTTEAVLKATLTQSGLNAPTINILNNNLGITYTLYRTSVGSYNIDFDGDITANLHAMVTSLGSFQGYINSSLSYNGKEDKTVFQIRTYQTDGTTLADGILTNTPIQITYFP